MFRAIALVPLLLVGACATYVSDHEQRLVRSLPNQRDVSISDQQTYPGQVLCGRYTALTGNGFFQHTRNFVVTPERVLENPKEEETWVYCTRNSAAALYERTGIGAPDGDWEALRKVSSDLSAIDDAILAFYNHTYALPQNLEQLLTGPTPLDEATLVDPWGRSYEYRGGLTGRTVPRFELYTLGADGEAGGQGPAADVTRSTLPLLQHVLKLEAP